MVREHLGTIEKVIFTSEPGVDVPAYVCLRTMPGRRTPTHLPQGHSTGTHLSIGMDFETNPPIGSPATGIALGCRGGDRGLCIEQRAAAA